MYIDSGGMKTRMMAVAIGAFLLPICNSPIKADEWKILRDGCQKIRGPDAKVRACLALIATGRLSSSYVPQAYQEVAHSLFERERYSEAIGYIQKEIEVASEYVGRELRSEFLSDFARRSLPAQMSHRYWRLGMMRGLARLQLADDKSVEGYNYVKAQHRDYSAAISLNPRNHLAFIGRAETNSLLCNAGEAEADRRAAIREARAAADENALRNYGFTTLAQCVVSWRGL